MDVSNTDLKKPKKEKKKKSNKKSTKNKRKVKEVAKSFNTYNKKLNIEMKKGSKNEFEGSFDYSPMMNIYKS